MTATRAGGSRLADAIEAIRPLDPAAMDETRRRLDALTKPPGSLGRLEELAIHLAGVTGRPDATCRRPAIIVAAADHGVARRGVSAYPSSVTAEMVANFLAGGAAINVLAASVGATLTIVDVGVASSIEGSVVKAADGRGGVRLVRARIRHGTDDLTIGPAMSRDEALAAIEVGLDVAIAAIDSGADVIGVGEMGIGNTTAASAITAVLTGRAVPLVTGRGTGVDDDRWRRKVQAVQTAIEVNRPDLDDPVGVLAAVGGLEIAALVGVILAGAARRVPLVLDGFITGAAALVATRLAPAAAPHLVAAHRSAEPGHAVVLDRIGLRPLLELDLRLGEGTGAALAIGLIQAACRLRDGMATFDSAGVSGPSVGDVSPAAAG